MSELPSGTVTFLFTDIEGSTRLWEEHPDAMQGALARHDELLRAAIEGHAGHVVKTTGDGFHAAFATAADAVDAAVELQRGLAAEEWQATGPLRVRVGVHTGAAKIRDGDYYGTALNRAARLMSVGHGGQVLVSVATGELLPAGHVELVDLGDHRLRDVAESERVFQVVAAGLVAEFPPLRSLDLRPGNLPRQVTTFVGRELEIASIVDLVRDASVVTLTGVGGVGKTRLSLEVAAEVVPEFADGAWFCEFAPVADPGAVWEALAGTLRVQPFPGRTLEESVLEYLAAKRLLLVLDNCEHLLVELARVVDAIVRRCPEVSVLATSREGLGLVGERIVAVPSLGVPPDGAGADELLDADAVRLFGDRAQAAKADFSLTDRNAGAVGVLCRRLDGIPLAIELAAARVRSMALDDLVTRLDQRFKLLTKGSRAALERQQTLRATIDWSYDLLDPTERLVLDRLSVFAGGCDLAAAEAVVADDDLDAFEVDDALGQLVDKSLVVMDDAEEGVRYRLLETIRQYAQERLEARGESAALRRRHADHYVARVETAGPHLKGADQVEWTEALIGDVDNLRATLDWAIETPSPDHALRLIAPLTVDNTLGDTAGEWAAAAVAIPGADTHTLFPVVAGWACWGAARLGRFEQAEAFIAAAERAQAALGGSGLAVARNRGVLAWTLGDVDGALPYAEEYVELARTVGDDWAIAQGLVFVAMLLNERRQDAAAFAAQEEAIGLARERGFTNTLAYALMAFSMMLPPDESDRAITLTDEAAALAASIRSPAAEAAAVGSRAIRLALRGEWHAAFGDALDAYEQLAALGDTYHNAWLLELAGRALLELGAPESAAIVVPRRVGALSAAVPWMRDWLAGIHARLVETLGEPRVAELAAVGATMDPQSMAAYLRAEADRILGDETTP